MPLLNSTIELNQDKTMIVIYCFGVLGFIILCLSAYVNHNEDPKYRLVENTKTNEWIIEERFLFWYITLDKYLFKYHAESVCTQLNEKLISK